MDVRDAVVPAPTHGYDADFVKPLENKYKCPVCKKALRNPVQTPCAHRLCESCAQPILRSDNPRCPLDDEELALDEVFRDVCCRREVMELSVYCNNKSKGCPWVGELNGLEAHINQCGFEVVQCPNTPCEKKLPRNMLETHIVEDCLFRPLTCEHCQMFVDSSLVETHNDTCPEYPIPCESGCGEMFIPRSHMTAHLANECTKVRSQCRYHKEGCLFMGFKDELEDHEMSKTVIHLVLIKEKLSKLSEKEDELVAKFAEISAEKKELEMLKSALESRMDVIEQENDAQRIKLAELETSLKKQVDEISFCRTKIDAISSSGIGAFGGVDASVVQETQSKVMAFEHRLAKLEKDVEDVRSVSLSSSRVRERQFHSLDTSSSMSVDRRLERTEHQLTLHDIQLAEHDLKIQMLDTTSYDGSFVWKIDDFTRRRHEALTGKTTSIYSPPFYLGRYGYKVCARVYLNGDGSGRGTHLSLFFVVMRGEYDALLNWPFQQLVTFKLLHQGGNRSLDIIDSFRPDSRSASFRRPTSNMNIASGCPEFAAHDLISSGNFIVDDTIYLKIVVDMRGLDSR